MIENEEYYTGCVGEWTESEIISEQTGVSAYDADEFLRAVLQDKVSGVQGHTMSLNGDWYDHVLVGPKGTYCVSK